MGWRDLLQAENESIVLPWIGGRSLQSKDRTFKLVDSLPPERGWCRFRIDGRKASFVEEAQSFEAELDNSEFGYLVGDRLVADTVAVDPNPVALSYVAERVFLIEPGMDRFVRVEARRAFDGPLFYIGQAMPTGPEMEVMNAFLDRLPTTNGIRGVVPALDAAFRLETSHRIQVEHRRAEIERLAREEEAKRIAEERRKALFRQAGDSAGRRELAQVDFDGAARSALKISGAEFLDARPGLTATERVVRFRNRGQRFVCTCHAQTLRIIDAGICLSEDGIKGDTFFTLESLPSVINEAIDEGVLVILRHA